MNSDGVVNQELLGNFQLLCDLISQSRTPFLKVDLSKLEDIIRKRIPSAMGKNAPPDYYELYVNFKAEYDKFRDYILYDRLIGKNVVALGGGFSSGKSSFLNALTGEPALPEAIEPTTAVPWAIFWRASSWQRPGKSIRISLSWIPPATPSRIPGSIPPGPTSRSPGSS